MNPHWEVKAEVTLLPTEKGGRDELARFPSYRPQFYYAGNDWDARYEPIDEASWSPGETKTMFIRFMSPEVHIGKMSSGMPFLIREGNKVVGYGSILECTNHLVQK